MRQQDSNPDRSTGADDSVWSVLPVAIIVILSVGIFTMGVLKTFTFGPSVGDVIVFRPTASNGTNDALARADITAILVNGPERRNCTLNPSTMAAEGGSLLIERSFTSGRALFQAHWAGHRTSRDQADCGASADLLIQPTDLLDLAGFVGGFGFTRSVAVPSQSAGQTTALLD